MTTDSFATEVRRLIDERGITLTALAEAAEVDHAHLSRVLRGQKKPSIDLIQRVTRALQLPEDYFRERREAILADFFHTHPLETIFFVEHLDELAHSDLDLHDMLEVKKKPRRGRRTNREKRDS